MCKTHHRLHILLFLLFTCLGRHIQPLNPGPMCVVTVGNIFFVQQTTAFRKIQVYLFTLFHSYHKFRRRFIRIFQYHHIIHYPIVVTRLHKSRQHCRRQVIDTVQLCFRHQPVGIGIEPNFLLSAVRLTVGYVIDALLLPFNGSGIGIKLLQCILNGLARRKISRIVIIATRTESKHDRQQHGCQQTKFQKFHNQGLFLIGLFQFINAPLYETYRLW